jgi:hypothetical protein
MPWTEKGKQPPKPPAKPNVEKVLKRVKEERRAKPGEAPPLRG